MNLDWYEPFEINNSIIDIKSLDNIDKVIFNINKLNCKNVEFRFYDNFENILDIIKQILSFFDKNNF